MAEILDGKTLANTLSEEIKEKVKAMSINGIKPHFCVINIGDDPASKVYVRAKKRRAEKLGIDQEIFQLPAETTEEEALALIQKLNNDPQINGVMVQLPVPDQINSDHLIEAINPEKDVDALTAANVGRLWQGTHFVKPATACGIIDLLDHYQISLDGKRAVIIGRSNIVGKPLAALLLERNATVTLAHSHTKNLTELTKQADILVAAVGKAKLVTADMVKEGAVVIDVGINRIDGHLVGDVDFDNVKKRASYITPVPGGVGPLTVESLMQQVVALTRRQNGKS
ncbi:bifunctional methylenetetrahydrofolate dehydrogenase/methenyltetrahydrofolate cyclohydrolase [Lactobacillus mulieris]|jgi:bifunctional protein folD|uniref:Bifunctional protein FolD n=1 Tax=Lactobacillus mulieris TaxID=2508708 RepID=A0AAP3M306_9LACO|nr:MULTISPECIES: bifunctional methylenetetrahydrofolate dehydrogenase/methenyltetrahydrofolate cyclohydrolase [Lactobacillus]EEU21579.1 FolD protein [Lactobacillus jensenii 27-2-CHN]EEX24450.1 tetrahydrofolate dehydrogenase/cyclohydrolase, NAD(P)-binding domain protein [Lactobacillus jensenii 115-3-CHN]EFH29623.1 tetrahydrofolate dehydrogenase/cyclohydrolase, NAD(P)-binding domain protein [Lactobacillus jensenii JV-V16]KAA9244880.1 bifunctional methylenetetrahydrofolate dehydrogenase/methenylte